MSCDLAVWYPTVQVSDDEARSIYLALCDEDISRLNAHDSIDAFYADLTSKHPEIDDMPEDDIGDLDLCPWSIAFDRSPCHLIMCCVWPKANYVTELVFTLARKHGLAVYDPQSETITYPNIDPVVKCWWQFWRK